MQPLLIVSLFVFSLAFASPDDILYIEKLEADEAQFLDSKDFSGLKNIFTPSATYNPGFPAAPNITGSDAIIAKLSSFFPPGTVSQNAISTSSITLLPPFDEQGAAGTATGVVYTATSYIGQGKLTGQIYTIFAKYQDKYVKTGDYSRYGGWRISERLFIMFGLPVGNPAIFPASG